MRARLGPEVPGFLATLPSAELGSCGTRHKAPASPAAPHPQPCCSALAAGSRCPEAGWRLQQGELHTPGHVWGSRRKIYINWKHEAIACWLMHSQGKAAACHQAVGARCPCRAGGGGAVDRPPQLPGQHVWYWGCHLPAAPWARPALATGASQLALASLGLSCGVL